MATLRFTAPRARRATLHTFTARARRSLTATGLALALLATAGVTSAQDEAARANARAAASEGAKSFEASDWKGAIDLFERAESQFHSPVHLWYMARAAKEDGQLVRARESCLKVQREELPADASAGVVSAHEGCDAIVTELEGRIPTLTLKVSGGEPGAKVIVTRDGQEVAAAMLGIPAPLDPGEHSFSALADGYSAPEQTVTLAEGQRESVTLELAADPNARITPVEEPAPAGATTTVEDQGFKLGPPRWPSYVAWGLGAGGIAAGVVFGLQAQDKADQADELCGGSREQCALDEGSADADEVVALNDDAGTNQLISIIGYGAGGALLATGVVLWVLDVGAPKAQVGQNVTLEPVVGLGHLGLRGSF
jgi:hypothetical protein